MANNRMTEGVGKKIVEALKMQSDVEITSADFDNTEFDTTEELISAEPEITAIDEYNEYDEIDDVNNINEVDEIAEVKDEEKDDLEFEENIFEEIPAIETPAPTLSHQININIPPQAFVQSKIDGFEIPSNVAVLKQLISQLPAGVTKQTGALIIKQTMEALGISMKNVLQEAQQVQESLNNSSRECQASIAEYRKQINAMEKQAQKYQRQYAALNDIISLFIQTSI